MNYYKKWGALLFLLCMFIQSCASPGKKNNKDQLEPQANESTDLRPDDEESNFKSNEDHNLDKKVDVKSKRTLTLVAGGVGVSVWGLIGVVRAFRDKGYFIERFICSGWATLVCGAISMTQSLDDAEWYLRKLKPSDFDRWVDSGKKHERSVHKVLKNIFGGKKLSDASPALLFSSVPENAVDPIVEDKGFFDELLPRVMGFHSLESQIGEHEFEHLKNNLLLNISEAIRFAAGKVFVFSAYDDYLKTLARQFDVKKVRPLQEKVYQQEGKEFPVIRMNLNVPSFDFGAKRKAIRHGMRQARKVFHRY